jgi:hypothetical protein
MAKKTFFGVMLAMVLVLGMTVVGCGDGGDDSPGRGGTLTLTGIPEEYNGKYVYFQGHGIMDDGDRVSLIGLKSYNLGAIIMDLPQITNGTVEIPMYRWNSMQSEIIPYTGNHTTENWPIIYIRSQNPVPGVGGEERRNLRVFTFTNGSATHSW